MSEASTLVHSQTSPLPSESYVLRRRLLWTMGVRLLLSTLMMGATILYQLNRLEHNPYPTNNFVFWLVGVIYFLTLLYSLWFQRTRRLKWFGAIQLGLDVLLVSLLVLATGCQESLFIFCYLLVIIAGANLMYRQGAFLFAGLSVFSLLILMTGPWLGWAQHVPFVKPAPLPMSLSDVSYVSLVYSSAFFLMAFLASHLTETLRHTGEILQRQRIDLDNLEVLQQDILGSLSSGLITLDKSGKIQFVNASALRILGRRRSELQGYALLKVLPSFKQLPPEDSHRIEISYSKSEQEHLVLGVSNSPLRDREERRTGRLILFQDLTAFKAMEGTLKQNEKLAAVGQLAAGLAHEIRNPLAAISGATQLLQSLLDPDEDQQKLMNIVIREAERLEHLLKDFLKFARPKSIQKEELCLDDLIQHVMFLFAQDGRYQNIEVRSEVDASVMLWADASLLEQIVWNLLINACQAMKNAPGGCVVFRAVVDGEEGIWLEIEDNGDGIAPEIQSRIFEPFFSTKDNGTGLGLAVLQRIVADHRGRVEIISHADSEEASFTRFRLFFPNDMPLETPEMLIALRPVGGYPSTVSRDDE